MFYYDFDYKKFKINDASLPYTPFTIYNQQNNIGNQSNINQLNINNINNPNKHNLRTLLPSQAIAGKGMIRATQNQYLSQ